jgi:hypothetical protein
MQNTKANRRALRLQREAAERKVVVASRLVEADIMAKREPAWGKLQVAVQELELAQGSLRTSYVAGPEVNALMLRAAALKLPGVPILGV